MTQGVYIRTDEHRKILSSTAKKYKFKPPSRLGSVNTVEQRAKISQKLKGRKKPRASVEIGIATKKANFDKNGRKTTESIRVRETKEYKLWRVSVYERDNYTCIFCGQRGGRLNADHIKPFALYPDLRFAINNGRTLCEPCHRKTDTFGSKLLKYKL